MLRRVQNPDGGWGYFPGKQSWIEPTAWAALVLHGDPAAERAWTLLKSWQKSNGAFRPGGEVQIESWATALCLNLALIRAEESVIRSATGWLLGSVGTETDLSTRIIAKLGLIQPDRNVDLKAWPWKPNTSSWVEPTAHTLVALKRVALKRGTQSKEAGDRIRMGEAQLVDIRCPDGGWNYGSRAALGQGLASYPETTGIALLGLQGRSGIRNSVDLATKMARETRSPMARAWLSVALRLHAIEPPDRPASVKADILITAVEALGAPEGNYQLLKTGAQT